MALETIPPIFNLNRSAQCTKAFQKVEVKDKQQIDFCFDNATFRKKKKKNIFDTQICGNPHA